MIIMDTLGIKIAGAADPVQGIKIIRAEINLSISDIKNRAAQNAYIFECDAVDEEGLALIIRLFNKLTSAGVSCELYEHGRISTIEFFNNLTDMYSEIDTEIDELIDNEESGEI